MIKIKAFASSSKGNAYWINDGVTSLLIECGIPFLELRKGLNFQLSEIEGCLVSHEHKDHSRAVPDLIKAGIDCYMSLGTAEALNLSGHRIKTISSQKQFKIGTWTVLPFETQHDVKESLGFLLANQYGEKLLYATDTCYLKYVFSGLNYIMIECNYSLNILNQNILEGLVPFELKKRLLHSHFSLENVKDFLRVNDLSRVQEIWLIHLSDHNSDESKFKQEIQALTGKMVYVAQS